MAVAIFLLLRGVEIKATKAQATVQQWTAATQALKQEWQQDQSLMREPSNAATLNRSQFLNQMFRQKSFSWTTALMDLELVLPQGVQVININPQMTKDGRVMMR
ncbi:MAG: fimbrial assembly protein, partial [Acidobacteriaceae bacterium]